MYELYPYFTNDGSVGLFSPADDDVYHSTYGALSESYEKFILPANLDYYFNKNKKIKILDICFGIGYNSKSFLNYFYENYSKKNANKDQCNATIHANNIKNNQEDNNCIDKIDGDNKSREIFIHAIDIDKNLMFLAPFFKINKNNVKNKNLPFKQDKILKILNKKVDIRYKLNREINIILLNRIIENNNSILKDKEFDNLLKNKKYKQYFDKYMLNLFDFYKNKRYKKTLIVNPCAFLHNIYYRHVSRSYKNALRCLKLNNISIEYESKDARKAILESDNVYNIVFLDAFAPVKSPNLWTLEFFKLLYSHLENDGIIVTYSNSANIRNALIKAGFSVGKIYNESLHKYKGTAAVKNRSLIYDNKYLTELSEYDLGLLNAKAGIIYRDKDLSLDNETIIKTHKEEFEKSTLVSSSKYIKTRGGKNEI